MEPLGERASDGRVKRVCGSISNRDIFLRQYMGAIGLLCQGSEKGQIGLSILQALIISNLIE